MHCYFFAAIEAVFFPIPPDPLLIALGLGNNRKSFLFAAICSAGSVLGAIAGYAIGFFIGQAALDFFTTYLFSREAYEYVRAEFDKHAFLTIVTAAFTPLPYKVFTISAGFCKINFPAFVVASIIGRSGRFFAVGAIMFIFGDKAKDFIDRYFNLLVVIFFLLLIGFILLLSNLL